MDLKKLLQGDTGGMSEEDLIENSRGTYFEKFVDQMLAARKQMAAQKAKEAAMMQQLMQQMQQKPSPMGGMTPAPNAPIRPGGLGSLFPPKPESVDPGMSIKKLYPRK